MGITIVNDTQENFVIVDRNILMDRNLNMRDRGMLATLLSLPPTWDFSAKGMAAILTDGIDGVNASIKSLESKGYITRIRIKDERGRFAGTNLIIHTAPQVETAATELPVTEKPSADNPVQLNTQQVNTQELKNKESITQISKGFTAEEFHKTLNAEKNQIDYEAAIIDRPHDRMMIDTIVNLIAETQLSNKDSIRIMKEIFPIQLVKERFEKNSMSNVVYVVDSFKREKQKVTDLRAYLLTCLYNAPEYEDVYWQNQVNSTMG